MRIISTDDKSIQEACQHLRENRVVAYPTETVYGLGVNPLSEQALDALFAIKGRDPSNPVLMIIADSNQLESLVETVDRHAQECMERFWPGPLSLLLPPAKKIPQRLLGPSNKICVRCPDHAIARTLCSYWGGPVTSTSANLSGHPPARTAQEAALEGVSVVLDGGLLDKNIPSTIYDPESRCILRPGPITAEMIFSL